jgi:hypothetical protein
MRQPTQPEDSEQHENTAAFYHAQVALEQDRLRKAMEAHLLRRTVPSTRVFSDVNPQLRNRTSPLPQAGTSEAPVVDFAIVPLRAAGHPSPTAAPSWRVALRRVGEASPIIGLDIRGDTVVGRSAPDSPVDLNLDSINGASYGVSRRHALLRPTRNNLYLIDLESTNGTRCNGSRLGRGTVHVVEQGDTISFGNLTFEVMILEG